MENILWLFETSPIPVWPVTLIGWLGWFFIAVINIWLAWNWLPGLPRDRRGWGMFVGLAVMVVICNLMIGIRMPAGAALPLPGIPQEPRGPAIMLLSATPLLLAGILLGPLASMILGILAGTLRFLWDTRSIFTPLELGMLGAFFSLIVRQRYRTRSFAILREPLAAAAVFALIYSPVYILDATLASSGSLAARLDYALAGVGVRNLAVAVELLVAGLILQVLMAAFPREWALKLPLEPSPIERSLEARFLFGSGSLIIFLLVFLLAGDWLVAGASARQMLREQLQGLAGLSSQSVPFFLETGQNLAIQLSKRPELVGSEGTDLVQVLKEQAQAVAYFEQILIFDQTKQLVGNFSTQENAQSALYPEENAGLDLIFNGVISQTYAIPPDDQYQGSAARVSFVIAILNPATGQPVRGLIARTCLSTNPFSLPLITSLKSVTDLGGSGILLDENSRILYHPVASQIMSQYAGQQRSDAAFFDDTAPDGTRNLVYYQPVNGRSWVIVLTVPAQRVQQIAISIAAPLSIMVFLLAIVALISLRLGIRRITTSLQTLAAETVRITQGQLDHNLVVDGVDEVGQLRSSFEQMRVSLQARLAELNQLLLVSQGVASSLDVKNAVQPVLEAVIATGAAAVRVILPPQDNESGQQNTIVLSLGPRKDAYAVYDEKIAHFVEQQDRFFAVDATHMLGHKASQSVIGPVSFFAIALRYENRQYGVLWAGYDNSHSFADSDERFLSTLAGQAALAASNYHLFRSAEVGRQRLAAILASTPDPVLVIDQYDCLLLANPAAARVLGVLNEVSKGQSIEKVVRQEVLLDLLRSTSPDKLSTEVVIPGGRVYLATASPVVADSLSVGRVCILRDVTHFKELDKMKTEFVNTVSHDLRSPLTLIRGYASMLETLGATNEQHVGYARKIISGVDNMTRLVNTLLDLGRVEAGVGLQLERLPLVDIVEQTIATLQLFAVQKNIDLTVTTPRNTQPLLEADKLLFQQAIYNLVENAIKYTPRGGQVAVRLHIAGGDMLFEVRDSGIGIDPNDQPRLFEKFYRGTQREAREQKGSGLGLAIVKTVAEHHHGKVWLESQLGKGSTFFFQVPLRQNETKPSH